MRFGEDCKKENTNRQPFAQDGMASAISGPEHRSEDPLRAVDNPERGYNESMDRAFCGQLENVALSDKKKGSARPSSAPDSATGEFVFQYY